MCLSEIAQAGLARPWGTIAYLEHNDFVRGQVSVDCAWLCCYAVMLCFCATQETVDHTDAP